MKVAGVIFRAETSKRKEKNRQLEKVNGKTLLENTLDALSDAGVNEQVVVLGDDMAEVIEAIRPKLGKIKITLNVSPEKGLPSSIQAGIIVLSNVDAVFFSSGDQNTPNSTVLKEMVNTMEKNSEAAIISPANKEKTGEPLLFRKTLLTELMSLRDNQTLADVVKAHSDKLFTVQTTN